MTKPHKTKAELKLKESKALKKAVAQELLDEQDKPLDEIIKENGTYAGNIDDNREDSESDSA